MLDALFGNRTAAQVLMFIGTNREAYAQEIADRTGIALSLVQAQLRRLEAGGVLSNRQRGRMRFYSFNSRFPYARAVEAIVREAVDLLPDEDRAVFAVRRRPRAQ